jgi:cycloartenol synthase
MGSQLWDSALTVQAVMASNLVDEYGNALKKANNFMKETQVSVSPLQSRFFQQ